MRDYDIVVVISALNYRDYFVINKVFKFMDMFEAVGQQGDNGLFEVLLILCLYKFTHYK